MDYNYFEIKKYKSISSSLRIDLKNKIIPIIGVNECGKTTILKAIFAFDDSNDAMNNGSHLQDVSNLYCPSEYKTPSIIEAGISLDTEQFTQIIKQIRNSKNETSEEGTECNNVPEVSDEVYEAVIKDCPKTITIQRILNGNKIYKITDKLFEKETQECMTRIAQEVIKHLPRIVYFDDFNDSIPSDILISTSTQPLTGWAEIINNLFKKNDPNFSVSELCGMPENHRKSIIADAEKKLEDVISTKWTGMKLDEKDISNLGFNIEYKQQGNDIIIAIKVKEKIKGSDRFFNIDQRSKGFYWFFNFVMKTAFNPKAEIRNDGKVIFLLDEPGAYLHVSAQRELCKKLTECKDHNVIFCTHSHHLLNPEFIKLPSIRICGKEENGNVKLFSIYEYACSNDCKIHALEPIYEALGAKESFLGGINTNLVLIEGITDFYSFQMFYTNENISFVPFTGAKHINYFVPIFLSAKRKFYCLWDGDEAGTEAKQELQDIFGEEITNIAFTLSDIDKNLKKIEDLYDDVEIEKVKADYLKNTMNKKKTITAIFFHPDKDKILKTLSKTQSNFDCFLKSLSEKIGGRESYLESRKQWKNTGINGMPEVKISKDRL